jgi:hypothetical protein
MKSAEPCLHALRESLATHDRARQRAACDAVVARLPHAPEMLADVRAMLRQDDLVQRFAAAHILFRAQGPHLRLLPALLASLALRDGDRRFAAAHMLVQLGAMEPAVEVALRHDARHASEPARRRMAVFALRELAPHARETEAICLVALADPDLSVQRAALASLAKLADPSGAALERALGILDAHPDGQMQMLATAVVTQLASHHPTEAARIGEALAHAASAAGPLARAAQQARRLLQRASSSM